MFRPRSIGTRPALLVLLGAALLAAACDDGAVPVSTEVTVMTRNVYLGANIFRLATADSAEQLPVIAADIFDIMNANDFPARAGALAAEIEAANPHLVGLQEVELYRIQDPSDWVTGNTSVNATEVHIDFLQVLRDSLAARGLDYTVAAMVENADAELPAQRSQNEYFDIRMTDHDVILARGDVTTSSPGGDAFDLIVPFELATGDTIWFERGYTWVDVTIDDVDFTFVNTHLEISAGGQLIIFQTAQANELIDRFAAATPVVLVGDFNTGPEDHTYGILMDAFTDAWSDLGLGAGLTCCQGEYLDQTEDLTSRIDLILYAGGVNPLAAEVVGDAPADRTPSGFWPSDHAGVVATLRIEN